VLICKWPPRVFTGVLQAHARGWRDTLFGHCWSWLQRRHFILTGTDIARQTQEACVGSTLLTPIAVQPYAVCRWIARLSPPHNLKDACALLLYGRCRCGLHLLSKDFLRSIRSEANRAHLADGPRGCLRDVLMRHSYCVSAQTSRALHRHSFGICIVSLLFVHVCVSVCLRAL